MRLRNAVYLGLVCALTVVGAAGCAHRAHLQTSKIYDAERVTVYAVVQAQSFGGIAISAASQEYVLWTKSNSAPINAAHVVTELGEIRWIIPDPPPVVEKANTVEYPKSPPIEVTQAPKTVIAALRIPFETGSAKLDDATARFMSHALGAESVIKVISIVGHADSTGTSKINEPLAAARAQAVVAQIKKIAPTLVLPAPTSRGAESPLASNATSEGRTLNRRVAVELERESPNALLRDTPIERKIVKP